MLIGKTYWKGLVQPNILYATETINFLKSDLDQIQRIENKAIRLILQVPKYCAVEFLRAEAGISSVLARDIKIKLLFTKHCLKEESNKIIKLTTNKQINKKDTKYIKTVYKYLELIKINLNDLEMMRINEIKAKINEYY